jgi:3-methylcrotonyl-CoA carboxylase alpha subunit
LQVDYARAGFTVRQGDEAVCLADLRLDREGSRLTGLIGESAFSCGVLFEGGLLHLFPGDSPVVLRLIDPLAHAGDSSAQAGSLAAPMPGKVVALLVAAGQSVKAGQPLVVIEAMKMEHSVTAPADGRVTTLNFRVGEPVGEGAVLVGFEPA